MTVQDLIALLRRLHIWRADINEYSHYMRLTLEIVISESNHSKIEVYNKIRDELPAQLKLEIKTVNRIYFKGRKKYDYIYKIMSQELTP